MFWHNEYSMSIGRYSHMISINDTRLLSKFGLFKPSTKKYKAFLNTINHEFNEEGSLKELQKYQMKVVLYNRISLYETLYYGLLLTNEQQFIDYYKELYGREPEKIEDYERVLKDLTQNDSNLKTLNMDNDKEDSKEEKSFENIISIVESILGFNINRNIKLYQFKHNYLTAVKKSKSYGKTR